MNDYMESLPSLRAAREKQLNVFASKFGLLVTKAGQVRTQYQYLK